MARLGLDLETLETFGVGLPAGILVKRLKTGAECRFSTNEAAGAPSFSPYRSQLLELPEFQLLLSPSTAAVVVGYTVGRVLYSLGGGAVRRRDVDPIRCRRATH